MTPPASAAAQPAPRVAPPRKAPARPRRVSGPARPVPARPRTRTEPPAQSRDGLALGLLGLARSLAGHRLLDRLIRGRIWIGIVAFALIGIVTLQLGLLKLNSGIGRALEREASLQRSNAALSIENSELASGTRVETQAERLGMRVSDISSLHFLTSHPAGDAGRAAAVLRKPLAPASEPPGGSEVPATGTEEAASTAGEPSAGGQASSQETATQASGGSEAASAPTTQEAPSQPASSESGAASAPAGAATGASAPAETEAHTEAGGGTEAPGG